jgi:putative nucleotidyltransferase with HDIG domain
MTARILFVDDETEVLEGLKVRLRQKRQQWKMTFACGPKEAMAALEKEPFNIVVSDLRMPEMDGAELMQHVRTTYPSTSRVMLSGHGEERLVLRAMACSHEFLPKPSPPGVLEGTLERILALQALTQDEAVKTAVGRIGALPTQPTVYQALMDALNAQRTPEAVAKILLSDAALCAQLLHIVNSAYFRLARPIVKVEEAVLYLGLGTVRQLVLVAEVFQDADARAMDTTSIRALQEHSLLTASIASSLLTGYSRKDLAFIAALLHDLGKLVIATQLPDRAKAIAERMARENESMHESEMSLFGTTHAEIGAYIMGLWQLPLPIVEAVANHHHPSRLKPVELDMLVAVHVADFLAHEQHALIRGEAASSAKLDTSLLGRLGLDGNLNEWRAVARAHAEKSISGV